MKRNIGLIRDLLIFAEEQEDSWFAKEIAIGGWDQKEIVYNVGLALDAGFLSGEDASLLGPNGKDFHIDGMTYEGHEFLDQIRTDDVWNKVKAMATEKGVGLTVDIVKKLALKVIDQLIG